MNATAGQITYEVWVRKLGPGPVVTAFTVPASWDILAVPILSLTVTTLSGSIAGYIVREGASAPTPLDTSWTAVVPIEVVAEGLGIRTFYAWAKTVDGQVSNAASATSVVSGRFVVISTGDRVITEAGGFVLAV